MQDRPNPEELLEAVAAFLRDNVVSGPASSQLAFHARVAANALDIARRQTTLAPGMLEREHAALAKLLDVPPSHDVVQLNRMLCERIAQGVMDLGTPGLADCLWEITLHKLTVDQPSYESYVRIQRHAKSNDKDR